MWPGLVGSIAGTGRGHQQVRQVHDTWALEGYVSDLEEGGAAGPYIWLRIRIIVPKEVMEKRRHCRVTLLLATEE